MMNVANITESSSTMTFSARRRNHRPKVDAWDIWGDLDIVETVSRDRPAVAGRSLLAAATGMRSAI
jgi:N-acyl-D-aspartate/D-glutamate deacylase